MQKHIHMLMLMLAVWLCYSRFFYLLFFLLFFEWVYDSDEAVDGDVDDTYDKNPFLLPFMFFSLGMPWNAGNRRKICSFASVVRYPDTCTSCVLRSDFLSLGHPTVAYREAGEAKFLHISVVAGPSC